MLKRIHVGIAWGKTADEISYTLHHQTIEAHPRLPRDLNMLRPRMCYDERYDLA
jgi:hypothetical protein